MIKKSNYYVSFIPVEPTYVPNVEVAKQIEDMIIEDCVQRSFEINDIIQFAHAGENFESVSCPSCNMNLQAWWGNAMDLAYSGEYGFVNLNVQTPCCDYSCSLNDLLYCFPQGFYRTILTIEPTLQQRLNTEDICQKLFEISGVQWQTIHTHI